MEKPGIEPATPGVQDIGLSHTLQWLLKKTFCSLSGYKPSLGFAYDLCVHFMMGTPKGSPKVVL